MTSCSGIQFVELLKKIGYPDAESLDSKTFDWMFGDEKLVPFLETLCLDVQEENILSESDLNDYKEFQANELLTFCLTEKKPVDDSSNNRKKEKENSELLEDISEAKKYIETLELQKDNLTIHESEIIEKSKELENQKKNVEKEIMTIKGKTLPAAIKKYMDAVDSSIYLIQELDAFLMEQPVNNVEQPPKAFFKVVIKEYLEKEMHLLDVVHLYLNNSFKQFITKVNDSLTGEIPDMLSKEVSLKKPQTKQAAEALRLQRAMQTAEEDFYKTYLEKCKMESQIHFLNELGDEQEPSSRNMPVVQLQNKLKMLQKTLEEVEKEEEKLQEGLRNAICENKKTQYEWIAILCSKEKLDRYKMYLELLETPLDVIHEQRSRLDFLMVALMMEEVTLNDIKDCVLTFKEQLQCEATEIQTRLADYEEQSQKPPHDESVVDEGSLLWILNEIMNTLEDKLDTHKLYLTTSDVVDKAKQLKLKEKCLTDQLADVFQEQLQLLRTAEASLAMHVKCIHCDDRDFEEHPSFISEKFIMNLGSLSMKIQAFEERFVNERNNFLSKKEMISKNSNIILSRRLFIYALNNKTKLKRAVREIRDRVEHYEQRKKSGKGAIEA